MFFERPRLESKLSRYDYIGEERNGLPFELKPSRTPPRGISHTSCLGRGDYQDRSIYLPSMPTSLTIIYFEGSGLRNAMPVHPAFIIAAARC